MNEPNESRLLYETFSVCPVCLKRIPAANIVKPDGAVYLEKDCPDHGHFSTVVWRGEPHMEDWGVPNTPTFPSNPFTPINQGCPYDCGLCPEHEQQACCVLLEVTQRCNLCCPTCFASAGKNDRSDPSLATIHHWYERLLQVGNPVNIQITGGEPSVRNDLPEIIRMGKEMGFTFFQLNTNGIRIAEEAGFIENLRDAGLNTVFLQFDGMTDSIYQKIRGRNLITMKKKVIERCKAAHVGVVLVPTIIPGVNDHELGAIIQYALSEMPTIRCVHMQPICYMGRYDKTPDNSMRLTLPEIFHLIEEQTDGKIKAEHFKPGGGQYPTCGFQANFVLMEDGSLTPLSVFKPREAQNCCCKPATASEGRIKAQHFVAKTWKYPVVSEAELTVDSASSNWDSFLKRKQTCQFTISGMAFQDAWNLDLRRLKSCYILIVSPEGNLIPFCSYNLTNQKGEALYRK